MITLSPLLPFQSKSKGKLPEVNSTPFNNLNSSTSTSTRSSLLESLLKVSRKSNSISKSNNSNHNSYILSSFNIKDSESNEIKPIEELSWSGSKVIWTKGGSIYRTYSFKEQGQKVTQAIFATFEVHDAHPSTSANEASPIASTSGKSLDDDLTSFGPFHRNPPPAWTDDPLPLPIHPTISQKSIEPKFERCLVIFLSDIAFAYPPGGSSVPFHLPFHLKRAWALDKGLLLERAEEGQELFKEGEEDEVEGEMPTLYSLVDPAEEIKAVSSTNLLQGLFGIKPSIARSSIISEPIQDLKERIVFVSDRNDGSEPIVVSMNKRSRKITVWSYGRMFEENVKEKLSEKNEEMEDQDGEERDLPTPTATTSKNRPSTTSTATTGKRKRQASFTSSSHPDRTSRRISTSNTTLGKGTLMSGINGLAGAGIGTSEEADLLDVLGESLGTSMKRTTSTHHHNNNKTSTTSLVDRRTSVSRNELSITMDRMALGVGGSNTGGVNLFGAGVTGMGEMDREWTFVMERADEKLVSDILFQKVWELEIPITKEINDDFDTIVAHLFDSRPHDLTSSSTLAISLPFTPTFTLLLLKISLNEEGSISATPMIELSAKLILPVLATRMNILDLIYLTPQGEWGIVTIDGRINSIHGPTSLIQTELDIVELEGDRSRAIILTLKDGSRQFSSTPPLPNGLTWKSLQVLSVCLPLDVYLNFLSLIGRKDTNGSITMSSIEEVLKHYFGLACEVETEDSWQNFINSTSNQSSHDPLRCHLALPFINSISPSTLSTYRPTGIEEHHLFSILMGLHLLAEDSKLSVETQGEYEIISKLIIQLACSLNLVNWKDAYRRSVTSVNSNTSSHDLNGPNLSPFNLIATLKAILAGQTPSLTSFELSTATNNFGIIPSNFYGPTNPLYLTRNILSVYSILSPTSGVTTSAIRAQNATLEMDRLHWKLEDVGKLSFGVSIPLREALRVCQLEAPGDWSSTTYELISRPDLAKQIGGGEKIDTSANNKDVMTVQSIDSLCRDPNESISPMMNNTSESIDLTITPKATRFNEDRRLEEVGRMLQFFEPVTINAGERTLDQLTPQVQQSVLLALSNRTLSLPVGFAMYNYRTKTLTANEAVPILRIDTSARILPMISPVALVEKDARDGINPSISDRNEWPDFHSGVAAALAQQSGSNKIDSAQISFNKPAELDARHAGYLMGLGLVGDISAIAFNQAFEYLKMKHDPTSIGLLLGLAVTYVGTSDPKVTSLLSVHLTALHPPGSSALNVSGITQAAGLVGIGLLYLGTQRRSLTDIMIRELCSIKVTSIEDSTACREAYALSAGFAFGMINLGKGQQPSAISAEVGTLRTFRSLILGENDYPLSDNSSSINPIDVNITSSAATIAIGLMYLRTERQDVADILEIPDTARRLDYVRSDLLLLRSLARSIIMWDSIVSSKLWIESQVPKFIVDALAVQESNRITGGELDIARWNIIAGACFAIGLKYAGTAAAEAHATLIHYLDRLTRAAYVKAATVQGKIKRHAIRCCLSVIAISLSMVMAGTGEINVLRRLRVAHGHFSEGVTYGTHLASHMALGLLFVGSGLYTLGSSDCAIAAMLIAFYPSFPSTSLENRAHLQAYRHLWVLAVEPRCLQVKDVDTNESAFLPVRLRLLEKGNTIRSKALVAPTLIPDIKLIESIQIDSPRYWSFNLNLSTNPTHLSKFLSNGIIYVKRRTGHLSYAQDPRGIRSIFTRSKSETGSSVFDFGETARLLAPSSGGLRDFVSAFSDDTESIAAVDNLCLPSSSVKSSILPTAFEAFSASILLECLTRDKKDIVGVYLAIYQSFFQLFPELSSLDTIITNLNSITPSTTALLGLEQLKFLIDFYLDGTYKSLFGKPKGFKQLSSASITREPLIQTSFIDHVQRKLFDFSNTKSSFKNSISLRTYLNNFEWPTNVQAGEELTIYLLVHSVPSIDDLIVLKELVQSSKYTGRTDEEVVESIKVLLRCVGNKIKTQGGTSWSWEFGDLAVEIWLGEM